MFHFLGGDAFHARHGVRFGCSLLIVGVIPGYDSVVDEGVM